MIIKQGKRLYGVVNNYIIRHSESADKIKLTTPGIDSETIYQGEKSDDVYNALAGELSKKTVGMIDIDAIVAKVNPPAPEPEPEAEEAPEEEAPAEE